MEELFIRFGGNRKQVAERANDISYSPRFRFVSDRLDCETSKKDSMFENCYLTYPGLISKPTRAYRLRGKHENIILH